MVIGGPTSLSPGPARDQLADPPPRHHPLGDLETAMDQTKPARHTPSSSRLPRLPRVAHLKSTLPAAYGGEARHRDGNIVMSISGAEEMATARPSAQTPARLNPPYPLSASTAKVTGNSGAGD